MAPDRPVSPGGGAAGAALDWPAHCGVAERGPVLPRRRRRRARGTDRRRAAGAAAGPGPGPSAGTGHALAPVLGPDDCPAPGERGRSACPSPGAPIRPGHQRACRVHCGPAAAARRRGGPAARPGRQGSRKRADHPVPGRGTGADGPLPQRAVGRGGTAQCGDRCPSPGYGNRAAAGLPGIGRARVPDRHRVGRPRRGLA